MSRLRRPAWSGVLRKDGDRGAVATIVAILLAGGVLLGFLALVVDVGQIYVEREELQSGADAAALAVAKACAADTEDCDTKAKIDDLAQGYANDNAGDGVSNIVQVCGRLSGKLGRCDAPADNLTRCLGDPPSGSTPYVEVRLSTELPDGRFALPPLFAQAMAGNRGYTGTSVASCARATWQARGEIHILAITMSVCEYNHDIGGVRIDGQIDGSDWGDAGAPELGDEDVINFWHDHFDGPCDSAPDDPGPGPDRWEDPEWAAFLDHDRGGCEITMPADSEVEGQRSFESDGRDTIEGECADRLEEARRTHEIVYIPIHDAQRDDRRPGHGVIFHHSYLAPFLVTGFKFGPVGPGGPGGPGPDRFFQPSYVEPDPGVPCPAGDERCLSGIFLDGPIPASSIVSGDTVVRLIG